MPFNVQLNPLLPHRVQLSASISVHCAKEEMSARRHAEFYNAVELLLIAFLHTYSREGRVTLLMEELISMCWGN